ncbi:transmembrane reductase CYB561D2-like [Amphiura filiformis]|uniref:transmembrane reductase CYB561D2-like n=1 Tax=Amphiura filiformis TaxID=82378 RepID=UPI003B210D66
MADKIGSDRPKIPDLPKPGFCKKLFVFFTMVAHIAAIVFTGYVVFLALPGNYLFAWHPILMSIAFGVLTTEAILYFSPESTLIPQASRSTKVGYHWATNTTAIICGLIGLTVIVSNKYKNGKPHFTTWHGTLGLITIIYMCVQGLAGTTLLYPKLLAGKIKLADQKIYHATSGLFLYTSGLGTLVLALFSSWYTTNAHPAMWWVSLSCLAWLSLVIMNQVTSEYIPKALKKPSQQY